MATLAAYSIFGGTLTCRQHHWRLFMKQQGQQLMSQGCEVLCEECGNICCR